MIRHFFQTTLLGALLISCNSKSPKESASKYIIIENPAQPGSEEPSLFASEDGTIYFSWVHTQDKVSTLQFSTYREERWSQIKQIAEGDDWFVNWADFPSMAVQNGGYLSTFYLAKNAPDTYAYGVNMLFSSDGGRSWSDPMIPHETVTETEHGFVSLLPWKDAYFATWLDGRNTKMPMDHDEGQHHGYGAMSLRGAFIDREGTVLKEFPLDEKTCDCCQTSAVKVSNGILLAFRDRSDEEVRDISLIRFDGANWSDPYSPFNDSWKIAGCPVNGPALSSQGDKVALAWFTAAKDKPTVKLVISSDGGQTFGPPIVVSDNDPIGRVDVEVTSDLEIYVSWMEPANGVAEVKLAQYSFDRKLIYTEVLASTSLERSSGFPRMAANDQLMMIAWRDVSSEGAQIRTAVRSLQ